MTIFCLEEFKVEFEKLMRKNSYRTLEQDLITYFFNKSTSELCNGTRLNNSQDAPYIKKRLNGSGGFRCYFLLIIKNDCLYLMFVHPKTGSLGYDNITDESKAALYKKILSCIESNDLYKVELNKESTRLTFSRIEN
jgi:hypothetical protein